MKIIAIKQSNIPFSALTNIGKYNYDSKQKTSKFVIHYYGNATSSGKRYFTIK